MIVVGYKGGQPGRDALAFGAAWCRASGEQMRVVSVHPGAATGVNFGDAEFVAHERQLVTAGLEDARGLVPADVDVELQRLDARSAAQGLSELADTGCTVVVLGARHSASAGRTRPGSAASRVLSGSELPVALVPLGYADSTLADHRLSSLIVAFVDTPDGAVALRRGADLAVALHASVRVVSVVPDTRVSPAMGEPGSFGSAQRDDFRSALEKAAASVPGSVTDLREGHVVDTLAGIGPDEADALVCGSRSYGPVRRVLLGGVSGRVVRGARLPVIVVPRGDA